MDINLKKPHGSEWGKSISNYRRAFQTLHSSAQDVKRWHPYLQQLQKTRKHHQDLTDVHELYSHIPQILTSVLGTNTTNPNLTTSPSSAVLQVRSPTTSSPSGLSSAVSAPSPSSPAAPSSSPKHERSSGLVSASPHSGAPDRISSGLAIPSSTTQDPDSLSSPAYSLSTTQPTYVGQGSAGGLSSSKNSYVQASDTPFALE